jgi:hypothetical protein
VLPLSVALSKALHSGAPSSYFINPPAVYRAMVLFAPP